MKMFLRKFFQYYAILEIIKSFLVDYIGVKEVLDLKSFEQDGRTELFTCRVKYRIKNNHWLNIKIGDKQAWGKSSISSNLLNNLTIDGLNNLMDFFAGSLGDPDYSVDVMYTGLLITVFSVYLTYFTADYRALMAQKVYNRISGLELNNQKSFFGIKISNAESNISGVSINGYYAFSPALRYGELIIR